MNSLKIEQCMNLKYLESSTLTFSNREEFYMGTRKDKMT